MRVLQIAAVTLTVAVGASSMLAHDNQESNDRRLEARLSGFNETPQTLSTPASGEFVAKITTENTIEYELTFRNIESFVTQAHIHFGAPGLSGGIAAWLCGTATNPGPEGTPSCGELATEGKVTGTITADDVVGPAGQGIAAGEFEEFLTAIHAGVSYANVHSNARTGGEIRGAIR
jgi:hypothetical protein